MRSSRQQRQEDRVNSPPSPLSSSPRSRGRRILLLGSLPEHCSTGAVGPATDAADKAARKQQEREAEEQRQLEPSPAMTSTSASSSTGSSPGTPPKKVWERSYRNFLKSKSSNGKDDLDRPQHNHLYHYQQQQLQDERTGNNNTGKSKRISSLAPVAVAPADSRKNDGNSGGGGERESSVRGGKLFASVFRSGSGGSPGSSALRQISGGSGGGHKKKTKSLSTNELDDTLRRGTEKSYSPSNSRYKQPPMQQNCNVVPALTSMPHNMSSMVAKSRAASAEEDVVPEPPIYLTSAAAPPPPLGGAIRSASAGALGPSGQPLMLRPRTSSSEDYALNQYIQTALTLDAAATGPPSALLAATALGGSDVNSNNGSNHRGSCIVKSSPPTTPTARGQVLEEPDDDFDPGASSSSGVSSAMKKSFTEFHNSSATGRDAVCAYLGDDPSGTTGGAQQSAGHSLAWTQNQQKLHSMMVSRHRIHASQDNLAGVGQVDGGTVAFNSMLSLPSTSLNDLDIAAASRRASQTCSTRTGPGTPLETVVESTGIHGKDVRILKKIQSADEWQTGRRYLVAPAALAACPVSVLKVLAGNKEPISASEACARKASCYDGDDETQSPRTAQSSTSNAFGTILLGQCLLGCKGKWSSAVLVLRQNYLLEFSPDSAVSGLPRGYAHLQYARCYTNADFPDALEMHFYGSPCAKADKRVLTIRVQQRDERNDWMECLNRAAGLRVEDLYEYDATHPLGKGSYASVFSGQRRLSTSSSSSSKTSDPGPHNACALKIFDKNEYWRQVVKGRERADTIVRETSVQAAVTAKCGRIHSFVRIRGFFETSDHAVIELELLDGTDLFKYISSKGVLKEPDAAHFMYDILKTLEAMNRAGLAHRDIKPANVLICQEHHGVSCKVADFGMSTFVGVDGHLRGRCGTPGYVAPEIFSAGVHGGYGNKVDIFSAGVTMYVMLCGYEPFYGETDAELIRSNKEAAVDFPKEEWEGISDSARDLVQKMMHADPAKRLDAGAALKHPWFQTHLKEVDRVLDQSISLPASEAPEGDACVIS